MPVQVREQAAGRLEAAEVDLIAGAAQRVRFNIARVIVGKDELIELVVVAVLSEGHILLEDVPGIGKTTLAKALARSLDCSFSRIQFTPDLVPSDITGISFFNQKTSEFELREGPLVSQVVLADEINRATPRTQSALLEAMEERQITIEGATISLPRPFLVLATQNPIELEGTFPLPEAQIDRFLLRLPIGYPSEDDEDAMLLRFESNSPMDNLDSVVQSAELLRCINLVGRIHVEPILRRYVVQVVRATRGHAGLELGASPRASLALLRASRALAAIQGRAYLQPDDVKRLAPHVLAHRLILNPQARLRGRDAEGIVEEILEQIPVPVET
jgi:MoxR-like ATPase